MSNLQVQTITPNIGAEVQGIDLSQDLSAETVAWVEEALPLYKVLVFRGQDITPEQQLAFGRKFGDVYCPAMSAFPEEYPDIMLLDTTTPKGAGADNWHTDASFMRTPPMGSILRPLQLPSQGGDTCFANMDAAYAALSPTLRSMLGGMTAIHDLSGQLRIAVDRGISPDSFEELQAKWPPVEHPLVRTHPVTGNKSLYINKVAGCRLKGLTDRENEMLLPFLLDHVRSPEFQCRIKWQLDYIVMWDNRCTQHCGVPDFTERRVMHRVTVDGDVPR